MPPVANVVLGVTGGIAAYKACELLRLFTESGYDVRVVPTESAVSVVEALVIGQLLEDPARPRDALIDATLNGLTRSGRSLQKDGQPLSDPAAAHALMAEVVRAVVEDRLPLLRTLGVVA